MTNSSRFYFAAFFILLMICCLPNLVMAQYEKEDVVYLKNGSILRGQIVERSADELIKLKMVGHNIVVIDAEEVEKIERKEIAGAKHYKSSGYINQTGMDLLPGTETTTVRFQMVNGYHISSKFLVGLGIGFVPYNDPLGLIPVFLNSRYKFQETNTTPFLFLNLGYNLSVLNSEDWELESHRGGLNLNPGMGLEFHTSARFGWYLTTGLNIDKASFEEPLWNDRTVVTDVNFRRLQVGIGLIF